MPLPNRLGSDSRIARRIAIASGEVLPLAALYLDLVRESFGMSGCGSCLTARIRE